MAKLKSNPVYKNHKVIMVVDDELITSRVLDVIDGTNIETEEGVLPISDSKKFFDANTGAITYVFDLDLPARVESAKLKELRRSVAIKNMFSYDKEKKFDIFALLPWVVTIITLLAS